MRTKTTSKKLLALLLTLVMVLGLLPAAAFATEDDINDSSSEIVDSEIEPAEENEIKPDTEAEAPAAYAITVEGGKASIGAGGEITEAAAGAAVTVKADDRTGEGMQFAGWEVLPESVSLSPDAYQPEVTFSMPDSAVSLKAVYEPISYEINSVAITATAPVAGQEAALELAAAEDANYEVQERGGSRGYWLEFETEPSKEDISLATAKTLPFTFEAGKYYTLVAFLGAKEGYTFSTAPGEEPAATVNSQTADCEALSSTAANVCYTLYCEEASTEYAQEEEAVFGLFAVNSEVPTPNFYMKIVNMPEGSDTSLNAFKAGDEIKYQWVIDNSAETEYYILPIQIAYRWGDGDILMYTNTYNIDTDPGEIYAHTMSYARHAVSEAEEQAGQCFIEATMTYKYYKDDEDEGIEAPTLVATLSTPVGEYTGQGGVYISKTVTSTPANGEYYVEGETVTFNTCIANQMEDQMVGLGVVEDWRGFKVALNTGGDYTVAPGALRIIQSSYVVDYTDCLQGSFSSYSTVTWREEQDPFTEKSVDSNVVQVPVGFKDGAASPSLNPLISIEMYAENPPADGVAYRLGEVVRVRYRVKNCSSQVSLTNVKIIDNSISVNYSKPYANSPLQPLETWDDFILQREITAHDLLQGCLKLRACVYAQVYSHVEGTGEYCSSSSNALVLPVAGTVPDWYYMDMHLSQKLLSTPANGKYFVSGETVGIKVTLEPDLHYWELKGWSNHVNAYLNTATGEESLYLENLKWEPGDPILTDIIEYTVGPEDVERGWISVEVSGRAKYHTLVNDSLDGHDTEYLSADFMFHADPLLVPCGWPKPTQVTLYADGPANGSFYVVGERVPLSVHVYFESAADGKIPSLKCIQEQLLQLTDGWEKVAFSRDNELEKYTGIYQGIVYYTVTQEDADRGSAELAYAFGASNKQGKQMYEVTSNSVEVPCGENYPGISITQIETSVPANSLYYQPGDTITYLITIANHGEEDLGQCIVTDSNKTGPLGSVEELKAGESKSFEFSLEVTEDLIQFGIVSNIARVKTEYKGVQQEREASVSSRAAEDTISPVVVKRVTSTPANGEYYTEGETITYELKLLRGSLSVGLGITEKEYFESFGKNGREFRFTDSLTGDVLSIDLNDPDTRTQTVDYLVTAADVEAGSVTNIATLQMRQSDIDLNWNESMNSNAVTEATGVNIPVVPPKPLECTVTFEKFVTGENIPQDAEFYFELRDESGPLDNLLVTAGELNNGRGSFTFDYTLTFTKPDLYVYTVGEWDMRELGWTYDTESRMLLFNVIEGEDGCLQLEDNKCIIKMDDTPIDELSFTNSYSEPDEDYDPTPIEHTIGVTKIVETTGAAPADTQFTFRLSAEDGTLVDKATITGAGYTSFKKLPFDKPGIYVYTVSEVDDGAPGWTYDNKPVTVTIHVRPSEDGLFISSVEYAKGGDSATGVSFTNSYSGNGDQPGGPGDNEDAPFTPVSIRIPIQKIVTKGGNVTPEARTFQFELYGFGTDSLHASDIGIAGNSIATNGAGTYNGTIVITVDSEEEFGNLTEGFYIRETQGSAANWTYSDAVYHVSYDGENWVVTKTDENGAKVSTASFTNKYTKNAYYDPNVPPTGDDSQPGLWLCLAIMGVFGMVGCVALPKLKKRGRYSK